MNYEIVKSGPVYRARVRSHFLWWSWWRWAMDSDGQRRVFFCPEAAQGWCERDAEWRSYRPIDCTVTPYEAGKG